MRHLDLRGKKPTRNKHRRQCRVCHAPADFAEVRERPTILLLRDGDIQHDTETVAVYYCPEHSSK